jgi:hypothetical protein
MMDGQDQDATAPHSGGGGVYQNTNGMPLADGRTLHMDLRLGEGGVASILVMTKI